MPTPGQSQPPINTYKYQYRLHQPKLRPQISNNNNSSMTKDSNEIYTNINNGTRLPQAGTSYPKNKTDRTETVTDIYRPDITITQSQVISISASLKNNGACAKRRQYIHKSDIYQNDKCSSPAADMAI